MRGRVLLWLFAAVCLASLAAGQAAPIVAGRVEFGCVRGVMVLSSSPRGQSCRGCRFSRLPEVKRFVYEHLDDYENLSFKEIHGKDPVLIFVDEHDNSVEAIPLSDMKTDEITALVESRGFKRKPVAALPPAHEEL